VSYDLILAADWEFDRDFIDLVAAAARGFGLSALAVFPADLPAALAAWRSGELDGRALFDRASATSPEFVELQRLFRESGRDVLEPLEKVRWASDKATMHLEFHAAGIRTPYTLILPAYASSPDPGLVPEDLVPLGRPFYVKPANTTGGSLGVVAGAVSLDDVERARRTYPSDKYLLQEEVVPQESGGRRFWFRGYFAFGLVQAVWWDDRTHLYTAFEPGDVEGFGLAPLFDIVRRIAGVCGLGFFSTEVARDREGRWIVVDYVNESCDMRLQSRHADGVPDAVVEAVASRIAARVQERLVVPDRKGAPD
jgi:hypothetical protein